MEKLPTLGCSILWRYPRLPQRSPWYLQFNSFQNQPKNHLGQFNNRLQFCRCGTGSSKTQGIWLARLGWAGLVWARREVESSNHSCLSNWELFAPTVSENILKHITSIFLLKTFHWFIIAYQIMPKLFGAVFKNPANLFSLTSCLSPMSWVLLASGSLCCFLCLDTFSRLVTWRNFYSTLKPLWKAFSRLSCLCIPSTQHL